MNGYLPKGIHRAEWREFAVRFGNGPRRAALLGGLRRALRELAGAGCTAVLVDGSFVTAEPDPGDFDCLWDVTGVDLGAVDPLLIDERFVREPRRAQKAVFGGELVPQVAGSHTWARYVACFATAPDSDMSKGLVLIDPRSAL